MHGPLALSFGIWLCWEATWGALDFGEEVCKKVFANVQSKGCLLTNILALPQVARCGCSSPDSKTGALQWDTQATKRVQRAAMISIGCQLDH